MTRLPEGYERPVSGQKYARLEKWDNRFRVLSNPIIGWVYFNHDGKPVRTKDPSTIDLSDVGEGKYWKQDPAHFWTFIVWDYRNECINILEITKKTVLASFEKTLLDPDFVDPKEYDIVINKDGEGTDTKYTFRAGRHSPIPTEIAEEYATRTIDLEALFEYLGDPYEFDGDKSATADKPF